MMVAGWPSEVVEQLEVGVEALGAQLAHDLVQAGGADVLVGVQREAAAAGAGDELVHMDDDDAGQELGGELLGRREGAL